LAMYAVSEEDAAAIRAAFVPGGEFAAAVKSRRRFPLIQDIVKDRLQAPHHRRKKPSRRAD
jgi:hypothetical protein